MSAFHWIIGLAVATVAVLIVCLVPGILPDRNSDGDDGSGGVPTGQLDEPLATPTTTSTSSETTAGVSSASTDAPGIRISPKRMFQTTEDELMEETKDGSSPEFRNETLYARQVIRVPYFDRFARVSTLQFSPPDVARSTRNTHHTLRSNALPATRLAVSCESGSTLMYTAYDATCALDLGETKYSELGYVPLLSLNDTPHDPNYTDWFVPRVYSYAYKCSSQEGGDSGYCPAAGEQPLVVVDSKHADPKLLSPRQRVNVRDTQVYIMAYDAHTKQFYTHAVLNGDAVLCRRGDDVCVINSRGGIVWYTVDPIDRSSMNVRIAGMLPGLPLRDINVSADDTSKHHTPSPHVRVVHSSCGRAIGVVDTAAGRVNVYVNTPLDAHSLSHSWVCVTRHMPIRTDHPITGVAVCAYPHVRRSWECVARIVLTGVREDARVTDDDDVDESSAEATEATVTTKFTQYLQMYNIHARESQAPLSRTSVSEEQRVSEVEYIVERAHQEDLDIPVRVSTKRQPQQTHCALSANGLWCAISSLNADQVRVYSVNDYVADDTARTLRLHDIIRAPETETNEWSMYTGFTPRVHPDGSYNGEFLFVYGEHPDPEHTSRGFGQGFILLFTTEL